MVLHHFGFLFIIIENIEIVFAFQERRIFCRTLCNMRWTFGPSAQVLREMPSNYRLGRTFPFGEITDIRFELIMMIILQDSPSIST